MKHLNSNILCAVAIQTTGSDAILHDILEIAIIPLSPECKVSKEHIPFNLRLIPDNPKRAEYNLDNNFVLECCEIGFDPFEAAELFDKWFAKLGLPHGKKIMVLCHNWASKRDFFKHWLMPTAFNATFSHEYRDPQAIGLYYNDYDDCHNEAWRFPKVTLSYMAAMQKVEYTRLLPTVIDECAACINLYRSLIYFS